MHRWLLVCALAGLPAAAGAFADVEPDHWAYEAVEHLARTGVLEGRPDGRFDGDGELTRYELAELSRRLLLCARLPLRQSGARPADVPPDHWAVNAVDSMLTAAIMELDANDHFHGASSMSRYDMADCLLRLTRQVTGAGRATDPVPFADVPADHWARPIVAQLVGAKVVQDNPEHLYLGDKTTTRYELAIYFSNLVRVWETQARD